MTTYAAIYEHDDDGWSAYVPDLPGCVAAGATLDETRTLLRGAVRLHIDALVKDGSPIPEPSTIVEPLAA